MGRILVVGALDPDTSPGNLGSEVIPFDSFDGLVSSYHKLVEEPESARNLADRAAVRAAKENTWDDRLERLLASL